MIVPAFVDGKPSGTASHLRIPFKLDMRLPRVHAGLRISESQGAIRTDGPTFLCWRSMTGVRSTSSPVTERRCGIFGFVLPLPTKRRAAPRRMTTV